MPPACLACSGPGETLGDCVRASTASPEINLHGCGISPPVSGCHSVTFADARSSWCPLCHWGDVLPPTHGVRGCHPAQSSHHKGQWYFHISLMVRERAGTTHPVVSGTPPTPAMGPPPGSSTGITGEAPEAVWRGGGSSRTLPHFRVVSVRAKGPQGLHDKSRPQLGVLGGGLRRAAQVSQAPHHPPVPHSLRAHPHPPLIPGPPQCLNPL